MHENLRWKKQSYHIFGIKVKSSKKKMQRLDMWGFYLKNNCPPFLG